MTTVVLLGGVGLSMGFVMGIITIVIGYVLQAGISILLTAVVAVRIGIGLGLASGFLVAKSNIPDATVALTTTDTWKTAILALLGGK